MRQRLVISDVTQMPRGDEICVVGINDAGECVRPICAGGFKKIYRYHGSRLVIYPRAEVEFDFINDVPDPPHVEDKIFNPGSITYIGEYDDERWEDILIKTGFTSVQSIFEGKLTSGRFVLPGTNTRSIGTLKDAEINSLNIVYSDGIVKPRLLFTDGRNRDYNFPVSDIFIREICFNRVKIKSEDIEAVSASITESLKQARKVYVRIGLARPWAKDGESELRCYPQVTGIHIFKFHTDNDIVVQEDTTRITPVPDPSASRSNTHSFPDSHDASDVNGIRKAFETGGTESVKILETLANCINPITGEVLSDESPFNDATVRQALLLAVNTIKQDKQKRQQREQRKPANAGVAWDEDEDNRLMEEYNEKLSLKEIASLHGRTQPAINARLLKLGFLNFH
jgi:hypothetical protein